LLRSEPLDFSSLMAKLTLMSPDLAAGRSLHKFNILQFIADHHSGSGAQGSANCGASARMTNSRTDYRSRPATKNAASQGPFLTRGKRLTVTSRY
jgi:hypothetical protein